MGKNARFVRPKGETTLILMGKTKIKTLSLQNLTGHYFNVLLDLYQGMLKKVALITAFFTITPSLILTLGVFLTVSKNATKIPPVSTQVDIAPVENSIEGAVLGTSVADVRPFLVERFLEGTPLEPYSTYIVEVSDKYGIDYRLIPAIAMKESGAGAAIDLESHNAWGFENGKTYFTSWEYAIDRVGHTLKTRYISKGLTTPDEIMPVYAPPQVETGGKWARDVNYFYTQMEAL